MSATQMAAAAARSTFVAAVIFLSICTPSSDLAAQETPSTLVAANAVGNQEKPVPEAGPADDDRSVADPMTVEDVMHARHHGFGAFSDGLGRWVDVYTAASSVRYRLLQPVSRPAVNQVQNTFVLRGRLTLDAAGRYAVHAGVASGRGFSGGWNTTGIGAGSPIAHEIFPKEVFVEARPLPALAIQVGGLYLERGEATEATTYDNDGYIVGERATLARGLGRMADEVIVTRAFLGDLDRTNVFDRLRRLDRANYYQALVRRRMGSRGAFSVDYTWQAGSDVTRAAATLDVAEARVVDRVRVEQYARLDPFPDYGYAVSVQRRFGRRWMAGLGFSDIDGHYGVLISDLNGSGRRAYASMSARIGPAWLASVQIARGVGGEGLAGPRTRVDVALGYDVRRAWLAAAKAGS